MLTALQLLQNTRGRLLDKYSQVPQLSCGGHYDLDQQLAVSLAREGWSDRLLIMG
jgi:hypothetical protein